jgi:soluble lytic murein transglycosylase-like protein
MNKFLSIAKVSAEEYNIPLAYLMAIAEIESAFDPYALRFETDNPWIYHPRKYANMNKITPLTEEMLQHFSFGLCQIMGSTIRSPLGFKGPLAQTFNPQLNLRLGAKYIKWLAKKYSDPQDLASAYNAGRPMRKKNEFTYHNQKYVDRFIDAKRRWERECR